VVCVLSKLKVAKRLTRKEDALMNEWTELQGPVLKVNGQLMLLVPLEDGGAEFVDCARGVSEVEGPHLKIAIPDWLAGMLRIDEGDIVCVSNWDGKLQIRPSEARLVQ
jgi:translation initiation factor IF-1